MGERQLHVDHEAADHDRAYCMTCDNQGEPIPYYSEAARAKQAALAEKTARGEEVTWTDLAGAWEPNPDLPDCPSWDIDSNVQCSLPHHHEGEHRAEVTW